ncbi:MAG TPA: hypothetical protein DDX93_05205 [Smithella sp.]|nr:hypothetical protein [Smithella sp.]
MGIAATINSYTFDRSNSTDAKQTKKKREKMLRNVIRLFILNYKIIFSCNHYFITCRFANSQLTVVDHLVLNPYAIRKKNAARYRNIQGESSY